MSWNISHGTITGPHHTKRNEPNQDSYGYGVDPNVIVVSATDGAGSLELSHLGAHLASTIAVETVDECLQGGWTLIQSLQEAVINAKYALEQEEDSAKMGCTLALGAANQDGWAVALVGDSFAVVTHEDGTHELVQPERESEYANITKLLTSKDHKPLFVVGTGRVHSISVATDGLEHPTLKNGEPLKGFWDVLVRQNAAGELDLEGLLAHMDSQGKIDDDTTLVIGSWREDGTSR